MAGMMAVLPALVGTAGSVAGMMKGSPASNVQPGMNPFQAVGMMSPWASQNGMDQIRNSPNIFQQLLPQYGQLAQGITNNPGADQMTQGAQGAAGLGMGAAGNMYGLGNFLASMGQNLTPYAGQILNTGFDPQNDLYNRTQHQTQEQVRASNAARGLNSSPFGAGVENKAMSDFNIDWQNNLLNRQSTAAQGAGLLMDQAGRDITGGASLMGQAPGMLSSTSMLPYQAYNTIGGNGMNALQNYGQYGLNALQQPQMLLQDFFQMMGLGNQTGQVSNQMFGNQLNQAQMGFNQDQTMGKNLGQGLAGLGGSIFGGGSMNGMYGSSGNTGGMGIGGSPMNSFFPSQSFLNNGMNWG